jgi:RNA polymerase sigma-70 factor (sigma-E family)
MDSTAQREFLEFCQARSRALFHVAYAITADQHLAEDLLQTALERVAGRWHQIGDPDAYARRIMFNESTSWWRSWRRRESPTADVPDRSPPHDPTENADLSHALRSALRRLGRRQRAVLVLRYLDDHSERDVAHMLGCSPSTVASQASRALARLRALCPELAQFSGNHHAGKVGP